VKIEKLIVTDWLRPSQPGMMLGIEDLVTSGAAAALCATTEQDPASTEFLRLANTSAAMIWMADGTGLCTFASPTWLAFRGRTLDQEAGAGWAEGIHTEDALPVWREYWAAFNARLPLRIEYRILGADGVFHRVERFGSPWIGADGELRGYVGCITLLDRARVIDLDARRRLAILSLRERQVLELIALGRSTRRIAQDLGISYKTADSHRTHLLKKLGIHEVAGLVRFAIRAGVIVP
jgi:PAS domain S-box-containing protein